MANIFDIDVKLSNGVDQNVDTHLLNEQFHVFSKSPSSAATSLGSASNRSGHTVTATDVWAEEIPAFYEVPDMNSTASLSANENDLCRVGNGVAIYKNGAWSLEYASYMDIPDGHEFLNASGKPVIRFHKNRLARLLTVKNNAADDGLNSSAKIQGWDKNANSGQGAPYEYVETAPKFVSQFVTSTDKIVDGKPSKGYGPFVMAGTTTGDITKVLNEGTVDDNDYVANSFAGIIQYNKKRTDAIYVHAFEYCGNSLKTAYSDIEELSDIISKISVTAKGGLQGVSDAAETAGISTKWVKLVDGKEVDALQTEEGAYPVLTITTGSVDGNDNAKLVTGSAVQTYVEDYVATNAKVSVNGQSATTITVKGTEESSSDIVHIKVTEDKTTTDKIGLTLTATIDEAVFDENGNLQQDGVVIATIAEKIADSAIKDAIETDKGAIKDAIDSAISGATLADGEKIATTTDTSKLVTVEDVTTYVSENAKVTLTQGTGITVTPNGEASTSFTVAVDDTVATKQSVDDLDTRLDTAEGTLKTLTETGGVIESIQSDIEAIETSLTSGAIHNEIDGVRQTANAAKATADTAVQTVSKSGSSTLLSVTQTGTAVTVGLSDTVATKSDITTEINKLSAADGAITALDGRVDAIETSLAAGGTTAEAIAAAKKAGTDAQTAADAKVADVTVDGTSIVSGNAGSKTVALTTTKGVEITPSATSTSTALATEASVAKAIASITSVGVSYEVIPDGQTHTSITTPVNGRIYLEKDTTNAEAGVYIEWMYTEKGWEQIGSTKTDHSTYASKITVNGSPKTVANSEVDLGAFASSVTAGNGVASGSVSATGALSLTLTAASTSTAGITKLDSTIADSTSETTAATPKAVKEYADTKVGDVQWFGENDILSSKAEIVEGKLVISEQEVVNPKANPYYFQVSDVWNPNITTVVNNEAFVGDTKFATCELDKLTKSGAMFGYTTNLSEFTSDLSKLDNGEGMFNGATELTTFIGDLSSLTAGGGMFGRCNSLITFISDLSSLTTAYDMFVNTNLSLESVECIADTINEGTSTINISWNTLPAEDKRQALVDELSRIVDKGWTLYTNVELTSLFDSEKYQTGEYIVQPKTRDANSEPVTVYYVVKK